MNLNKYDKSMAVNIMVGWHIVIKVKNDYTAEDEENKDHLDCFIFEASWSESARFHLCKEYLPAFINALNKLSKDEIKRVKFNGDVEEEIV